MANLTNRVLWWSLMLSALIYVVVAALAPIEASADAIVPMLAPGFAALSFALAIGTLLFRRRALVRPIQSGELDPRTPEGQQRAFVPFVLCLVLAEAIAINGLVLSFLSGEVAYSAVFSAAAIVLMFLHRPTAAELQPPRSLADRASDPTPL